MKGRGKNMLTVSNAVPDITGMICSYCEPGEMDCGPGRINAGPLSLNVSRLRFSQSSQRRLPVSSPLRTVHAPFNSHGSSLTKARR